MGKSGDLAGRGAIYRFYKGELRKLYPGIAIPNSICFAPDGKTAYFSDTLTHQVMKVALDAKGWPAGDPQVFLDLRAEGLQPDGSVVDAAGNFWCAQWGSARVAAYSPQGEFLRAVAIPSPHSSCPCFGGPDLTTLYCTSATVGMTSEARAAWPDAGKTFAEPGIGKGQPEPRVLLK